MFHQSVSFVGVFFLGGHCLHLIGDTLLYFCKAIFCSMFMSQSIFIGIGYFRLNVRKLTNGGVMCDL